MTEEKPHEVSIDFFFERFIAKKVGTAFSRTSNKIESYTPTKALLYTKKY